MREVESEVVNAENCNRKLRASTSKRRKKVEQGRTTNLPHDIIEIILLQLPVKDLIRYKVVSKQWKATISHPSFAQNHLQRYKNSSSRNLFAWYNSEDFVFPGFYVAKLQKNQFKRMSKIKFPRKNQLLRGSVRCNCDGLYLIRLRITLGKTYVVCNPSCRGYKEIRSPQKINDSDSSRTLYGIYYNPLMMDYRVVIADKKHYAVFSCRHNKWSEVKEIEEIYCSGQGLGHSSLPRVSFNGSLYWLDTQSLAGHKRKPIIICFDGKDEKFKKLAMPDCKGCRYLYLTSSLDHLCLFYITRHNEMMFMKTVRGDEKESWMEFKVQLQSIPSQFSRERIYPTWVSEDVIILGGCKSYYIIYDVSKSTLVTRKSPFGESSSDPLPYLESLFLQ